MKSVLLWKACLTRVAMRKSLLFVEENGIEFRLAVGIRKQKTVGTDRDSEIDLCRLKNRLHADLFLNCTTRELSLAACIAFTADFFREFSVVCTRTTTIHTQFGWWTFSPQPAYVWYR